MGIPSVHPTGVTIFKKDKCCCGWTLFPTRGGAVLIDMNGREAHVWEGLGGMPNKLLPGGFLMGSTGLRDASRSYQDQTDVVQADWNGNIVWSFSKNEYIADPENEPRFMARQHHDFQREGSPAGYYSPACSARTDGGKTFILTHADLRDTRISDKPLLDDRVIEVDWDDSITWEWRVSEHLDELGLDDAARRALYLSPDMVHLEKADDVGDWMHINSLSLVGANRHFDAGDERFAPDNLIMDSREANIMFIVSRSTGRIVWRLGPDFSDTPEKRALGQFVGQHHFHMIPRGLPGEGNMLVFDNGGMAGYGAPTPGAPDGCKNARRGYSRVVEFDPVTLKTVWVYPNANPDFLGFSVDFYSALMSSAQRLENGNTLITEGQNGRIFEVTPQCEIVWEYVSPYPSYFVTPFPSSVIYRAYRCPYDWAPLPRPRERGVTPPKNSEFHIQ